MGLGFSADTINARLQHQNNYCQVIIKNFCYQYIDISFIILLEYFAIGWNRAQKP